MSIGWRQDPCVGAAAWPKDGLLRGEGDEWACSEGSPTPILYMMAIREGSYFAWPTSYSPRGASWTWPKRGELAGGRLAARRL